MNDAELRALFHRLREEELPGSGFRLPADNRQRATGTWRWAFAALVLLMLIGTFAALRRPRHAPVTESIVTWKAPTDVLLRTPGSELLSAVPQIPERKEP